MKSSARGLIAKGCEGPLNAGKGHEGMSTPEISSAKTLPFVSIDISGVTMKAIIDTGCEQSDIH